MNQLSHARRCLTRHLHTPLASGLTGAQITLVTVAAALRTPAASARAPRSRTATAHT
jgi:hypothetical protein